MKLIDVLTFGIWGFVTHTLIKQNRIPQIKQQTRKFSCSLCRTVTEAYVREPKLYHCQCSYCGLPNEFNTEDNSLIIKAVPGKITLER